MLKFFLLQFPLFKFQCLFVGFSLLIGCQSVAQPAAVKVYNGTSFFSQEHLQPALIKNPSVTSHAVLTRAISQALKGVPVKLADDVFTKVSRVFIEVRLSKEGSTIDEHLMDAPTVFELVILHQACFLKMRGAEKLIPLLGVGCFALSSLD